MKKIAFVFITVVLLTSAATTAWAAEKTVRLDMPDITCARTAVDAQSFLNSIEGILSAEVDMSDYFATVTFDDERISIDDITEALKREGLPVKNVTSLPEQP